MTDWPNIFFQDVEAERDFLRPLIIILLFAYFVSAMYWPVKGWVGG